MKNITFRTIDKDLEIVSHEIASVNSKVIIDVENVNEMISNQIEFNIDNALCIDAIKAKNAYDEYNNSDDVEKSRRDMLLEKATLANDMYNTYHDCVLGNMVNSHIPIVITLAYAIKPCKYVSKFASLDTVISNMKNGQSLRDSKADLKTVFDAYFNANDNENFKKFQMKFTDNSVRELQTMVNVRFYKWNKNGIEHEKKNNSTYYSQFILAVASESKIALTVGKTVKADNDNYIM